MGLDMYLYSVRKISENYKDRLIGKAVQEIDFPDNIRAYLYDETSENSFRPFSELVNMISHEFDEEKFRKAKRISKDKDVDYDCNTIYVYSSDGNLEEEIPYEKATIYFTDVPVVAQFSVFDEIAYWQRAYNIDNWINKHCGRENTEYTPLPKETLEELYNDCQAVVEAYENDQDWKAAASEHFPDDNEYDYDDIRYTYEIIESILSNTDWDNEGIFYWPWW